MNNSDKIASLDCQFLKFDDTVTSGYTPSITGADVQTAIESLSYAMANLGGPSPSSLLPSQGGNDGKLLQTDGTNPHWVSLSTTLATSSLAGAVILATIATPTNSTTTVVTPDLLTQRLNTTITTYTGYPGAQCVWVQDVQGVGVGGSSYGYYRTNANGVNRHVWNNRILNTTKVNTITGCTTQATTTNFPAKIAGNGTLGRGITLPTGTYDVTAHAMAYCSDSHKLRLWNDTASTELVRGLNAHGRAGDEDYNIDNADLQGRFTLSAPGTVFLQHIFDQDDGGDHNLGLPYSGTSATWSTYTPNPPTTSGSAPQTANSSPTNIYANIFIIKIA